MVLILLLSFINSSTAELMLTISSLVDIFFVRVSISQLLKSPGLALTDAKIGRAI